MALKGKTGFFKYVQVTTTFGVTTALRIYLLGILGGGWVDRKLGTSPWFMLAGVVLAIVLSFRFLLGQLLRLDQDQADKKEK